MIDPTGNEAMGMRMFAAGLARPMEILMIRTASAQGPQTVRPIFSPPPPLPNSAPAYNSCIIDSGNYIRPPANLHCKLALRIFALPGGDFLPCIVKNLQRIVDQRSVFPFCTDFSQLADGNWSVLVRERLGLLQTRKPLKPRRCLVLRCEKEGYSQFRCCV